MFNLIGVWIYFNYKNEMNTMKGNEYVYKAHRNVSLKISQTRMQLKLHKSLILIQLSDFLPILQRPATPTIGWERASKSSEDQSSHKHTERCCPHKTAAEADGSGGRNISCESLPLPGRERHKWSDSCQNLQLWVFLRSSWEFNGQTNNLPQRNSLFWLI